MRVIVIVMLAWLLHPVAAVGQESADGLQGAFAVTIASEDVPPVLIEGASLIGRWHITFGADGTYMLVRQDVGTVARGQFETGGNQLTLRGETGVIACVEDSERDAAAVYEWEVTEGQLLLVALEEPCDRRRLLFTTRTLSALVACPPLSGTRPNSNAGSEPGSAIDRSIGTPMASTPRPLSSPQAEIDTLLGQMSDCWATREPDRFLQLLSREFRASQQAETEDDRRRLTLTMSAPIVWNLASEVETVDATHATASVQQTLGDTIDIVRQAFVYEEGAWRWDGPVASP